MGQCNYYFKARFSNKQDAKEAYEFIIPFIKEAEEASEFYQSYDLPKLPPSFWKLFEKQFPLVTEYLKFASVWGKGDIEGNLDFGNARLCNLRGEEISHVGIDVWHFADWSSLCGFVITKYKAIKAVCDTDENGCGSLDRLNLFDWETIVKEILKQRHLLPLLIHIDPELDVLLAPHFK